MTRPAEMLKCGPCFTTVAHVLEGTSKQDLELRALISVYRMHLTGDVSH